MKISKDVIVLPETDEFFILTNIFTKTSLGIDINGLIFFNELKKLSIEKLLEKNNNNKFNIFLIQTFSNYEGLLADPTRFKRIYDSNDSKLITAEELIVEFKNHFLLIDDDKIYSDYFQLKNSILDIDHMGNFHQQLGQYLMVNKREDPSNWWLNQKFNIKEYKLKNNLYSAIQGNFLNSYFKNKITSDDYVIDIGCGPGFYSNMIGEIGTKVLGVDPNEKYIEIARKNSKSNTTFDVKSIGEKGELDFIDDNSADYIFMSDALLFYFVPFSNEQPNLKILFDDMKRILKSDGTLISLEPHYIFWLLPWLGEIKNPYTVLTEYHEKLFGVTPTLSKLIQTYRKGGFSVHWMEELFPDKSFEKIDPRAFHFASKFPLWHLFELKSI